MSQASSLDIPRPRVYPPSCVQSLLPPWRTGKKTRQESRVSPGKAGPSVLGAPGQCRGANSKFPSCLEQQQPRAPWCPFPGVLLSSLPPVATQPLHRAAELPSRTRPGMSILTQTLGRCGLGPQIGLGGLRCPRPSRPAASRLRGSPALIPSASPCIPICKEPGEPELPWPLWFLSPSGGEYWSVPPDTV